MLLIALALIVSITLAILIAPGIYFWHGIRWLSFPVGFTILVLSQAGSGGFGELVGIAICLLLLALVGLLITIKLFFIRYANKRKGIINPNIPISKAQLCGYGFVVSMSYFYMMSYLFAAYASSWKLHLLILGLLLLGAGLVVYAAGLILVNGNKNLNALKWNCFLSSFIYSVFLLMVANAVLPFYVSYKAEEKASGRPYCIEVADKPAQASLDLSMPKMFAPKGYTNHAMLVVYENHKPQLFHWSYMQGDFISSFSAPSGWIDSYPAVCVPEVNFAKKLPFISEEKDYLSVVIGLERLDIPLTYYPRVSNYGRTISLITQDINFSSPDKPLNEMSWDERFRGEITIHLEPALNTINSSAKPSSNYQFKDLEKIYGLQKRIRSYKNNGEGKAIILDEIDNNGVVKTLIEEWSGHSQYHQYFLHDGWIYEFYHSQEDLENWKSNQEKIINLVNSFRNKEMQPY